MNDKELLKVTAIIIAVIMVVLCLTALADKHHYDNNLFLSQERLNQILSKENIMNCDRYLFQDADLVVTGELSDILDVQNWTRVKKISQGDEEPILLIEYRDFQYIYIYGTYACLEDGSDFWPTERAYFTFSSDISQELLAYLDTCEVVQ